LVRHTVRALGRRTDATDVVLGDLNDAILAEDLDDRFATAVYLDASPGPDGVQLRFTVGGHPLPLLRSATGRSTALARRVPPSVCCPLRA
jgi:hypothetical protein